MTTAERRRERYRNAIEKAASAAEELIELGHLLSEDQLAAWKGRLAGYRQEIKAMAAEELATNGDDQ